jgi:hypothetical protein
MSNSPKFIFGEKYFSHKLFKSDFFIRIIHYTIKKYIMLDIKFLLEYKNRVFTKNYYDFLYGMTICFLQNT